MGHFDFITYDDDVYVYENAHVQAGLTPDSIKWAFTAVVSANWMPVTLLSHMLDCAALRHAERHAPSGECLFHALSAVLLFVVLQRATGARWPSAFVAFVFALHPLHVESVAWVAERKDVLSAFFWFLALYCYVRYTERPGLGRYLLVARRILSRPDVQADAGHVSVHAFAVRRLASAPDAMARRSFGRSFRCSRFPPAPPW